MPERAGGRRRALRNRHRRRRAPGRDLRTSAAPLRLPALHHRRRHRLLPRPVAHRARGRIRM